MKSQVFIFPFAGGNVFSFQPLVDKLQDQVEVIVLELPGRGLRTDEPLLYNKKTAIIDLLQQLKQKRNKMPFLLYGHSLGAVLGFELNSRLEKEKDAPVCLVASGYPGPNVIDEERISTLPREAFFRALLRIGRPSDKLLANEELMDFFEPIFRADLTLLEEEYTQKIVSKINTAIHALMGYEEKYVKDIQNWRKFTSGGFDYEILEGDHFFLYDHIDRIAAIICKYLPGEFEKG
ncbi:thioesterase II family protein [Chitinophaga nivalis]|uniref:Alpha/beta fold hydrolase n=1 Tax=Chitinophaga nivalis TaxID=2991709 RepID=A0ABT3INK4_9BACT|nr:alpha/beta fold hydrolase [Chitinophaga nivalis]MCW3464781.1 alpha/beta fold hydrolase [Chitinophaga nivalis]MCW3485528.1 alpha/beta fold hydrolase [Chitinophaga nivalis]